MDLDLLSRSRFLSFLKQETEARACTIVYATHIFDNLAQWPTHLIHMHLGKVKCSGTIESFDIGRKGAFGNSPLGELVLRWLGEDYEDRGPRHRLKSEGDTYKKYVALER